MAVAFDSFFEDGVSSGTSISFVSSSGNVAGSVASNSNRALIVALVARNGGIVTSPSGTWNGVSLGTQVDHQSGSSFGDIWWWVLKAPDTGAQTITVSWTGAVTATLMAWSLYNVDQTTTYNLRTENEATSTALSSGSVSTTNGNMVLAAGFDNDASSGTFDTGGTSDVRDGRFSGNYHGAHTASTGATATISGTLGSSVFWYVLPIDIIAASAGGPGSGSDLSMVGISESTSNLITVSIIEETS